MPNRFERDTAVTRRPDGTYAACIDRGWWVQRGPNGGYVAAIVLRALTATVGDPDRSARSLTVHYLAPPVEGPVELVATVERQGRSMSFLSARLSQGGQVVATALAAFARPLEGTSFCDLTMPDVPPPETAPDLPPGLEPAPPIAERYDRRPVIGGAPLSGEQSVTGGWLRLAEPHLLDGPLVAAFMDAWLPPVFIRATAPVGVPTVDLTIHFRGPLPPPGAGPDDHYLAVFRTQVAAGGFVEEDGELWSRDGTLLAHSRQLAVLLG